MLMDKNLFHASTPQNLAKVPEQTQVKIFFDLVHEVIFYDA